jgi:putative ABC transport system substrate-binding protein
MRCVVATGVALAMLLDPDAPAASQAARLPMVAVLSPQSLATGPVAPVGRAFREGLAELGWTPGQNVHLEYRWADGQHERLEALARELVALKPDVILANSGPAASAAKRATATIPIVFETLGDPVAAGLVPSLARPGGNMTGLSGISAELSGKRLELLRELVPGLTRLAMLVNPGNIASPPIVRETEQAARASGMSVHVVEARRPAELDRIFAEMAGRAAGAVFVVPDVMLLAESKRILALIAQHRLPSVFVESLWVPHGGLMSYAPSLDAQYRRAAVYVDKILKGARPADLPVEQPTTFELLLNLKAARSLGLTVPRSLLIRASQVFE